MNECPCCETVVFENHEEIIDEDTLLRKKECPNCGCFWNEIYDLSMPDIEIEKPGKGYDEKGWLIEEGSD